MARLRIVFPADSHNVLIYKNKETHVHEPVSELVINEQIREKIKEGVKNNLTSTQIQQKLQVIVKKFILIIFLRLLFMFIFYRPLNQI